MTFARFSVFTAMERNEAILTVRDAISNADGWIVDQTFFSNIATTINFELPASALQAFQDYLTGAGLQLHIDGDLPANASADVRSSISLTFSHNEPDQKQEIPPFG